MKAQVLASIAAPTSVAAAAEPAKWRGNAFAALHSYRTCSRRSSYKVTQMHVHDGHPADGYGDFFNIFTLPDQALQAKPVGLGVTRDGSPPVSDEDKGMISQVVLRDRS